MVTCTEGLACKAFGDRQLKAGTEVIAIGITDSTACSVCQPVPGPEDGSLEPGKRQVHVFSIKKWPGKFESTRVSAGSSVFNRRPAGKAESEHPGNLVERFAWRIVDGSTESLEPVRRADHDKLTMTARGQQHEVRISCIIGHPRSQRMTSEMIDANERFSGSGGKAFRAHDTAQQSADQSGSRSDRNGVHVRNCKSGFIERSFDGNIQLSRMCSCGNLGNNASVGVVEPCLVQDD